MGGTEKYREKGKAAVAAGPWVLLQAWPSAGIIPLPISAPLGREHLERFGAADDLVSTEHCQLEVTGAGLSITDLGSTNGTWIDGRRAARGIATEGAVLRIGGSLFVVRRCSLREPQSAISGGDAGDLVAPFGLRALHGALDALARTRPPNVLITGETGTGKEPLARHVAMRLARAEPFEAVNAAAYRTDSFDAAFFGYERGAFTGAQASHAGIVGAAEGGTLFLDELGDMPTEYQPLLLRFLETREVRRLGATSPVRASVLIIAATNRDLESAVEDGTFREDLLARFGAPRLHLPPLRDRREDIPSIARVLAARAGWSLEEHADVAGIERLMVLPLRRNVRELRGVLEEALAVGGVEGEVLDKLRPLPKVGLDAAAIRDAVAVHDSERQAAKALGISRRQVRKAMTAGSRTGKHGPRTGSASGEAASDADDSDT